MARGELPVGAVEPRITQVATGVDTYLRTIGGALGARTAAIVFLALLTVVRLPVGGTGRAGISSLDSR
ncbi:hypothetical protein GCM10010129_07630 [Streptomyces fumigatiscleroticus]|nr:hypothetical protein GCM10010129_07630 [Streptomyces fumigatiscleroticus]